MPLHPLPPKPQLARAARAWQRPHYVCLPECGESSKGATARAWLGDAHSSSPPPPAYLLTHDRCRHASSRLAPCTRRRRRHVPRPLHPALSVRASGARIRGPSVTAWAIPVVEIGGPSARVRPRPSAADEQLVGVRQGFCVLPIPTRRVCGRRAVYYEGRGASRGAGVRGQLWLGLGLGLGYGPT